MTYTKEEIALKACDILEEIYPDSACALKYDKPYELLISVRLSAQCTDARVNIVTQTLLRNIRPWNLLQMQTFRSLNWILSLADSIRQKRQAL